jgi:hypothetical protein
MLRRIAAFVFKLIACGFCLALVVLAHAELYL